MAKHVRYPGSVEAQGTALSTNDVASAYMDYDGAAFAQFGAKGPGSLGVKIKTVLAGIATTVLSFAAAGAATFIFAMSAPGITSTSGLTVSSGTSALQAITGTTLATTDKLSVAVSGMTNAVKIGQVSDGTTYGTLTFNNAFTGAGLVGLLAGASGDDAMYVQGGTTSGVRLRVAGTSRVIVLDATTTISSTTTAVQALSAAGAITSTLVTGDIFSNISSTGTSIIKVGQGASNNIQFYWSFNATPASAIGNIATFGYTNPIRIDGSSVSINSQSGGSTSVQALTATTITGTGVIRNEAVSGGFAMGVISSVPRITYNSGTTSFAFLTGGNGDATLTTGHLYAESDAIFDIGQSTSLLRYRNLFLSGDITVASGKNLYLNNLHNATIFESAVNVVDLWSAGTRSMAWSGGGVYLTSIGTTASAANVFTDVANSGLMARSTSSRKYKSDIALLSLEESRKAVLETRPVKYHSTSKLDDPERWFVGIIAEEMFKTDSRFVHLFDKAPDGVMYDRLVAPLLVVIQDQNDRIQQLERRIAA